MAETLTDFSPALDAAPQDADLRRVYADALEESGDALRAEFQRWFAVHPAITADPDQSPENPYRMSVTVDLDMLPKRLVGLIRPPHINANGGPEDSQSERILLDLWTSREACEADLFAAWLRWRKKAEALPLYEGPT